MGAKLFKNRKPLGCLVVGAEATNPDKVLLVGTIHFVKTTIHKNLLLSSLQNNIAIFLLKLVSCQRKD